MATTNETTMMTNETKSAAMLSDTRLLLRLASVKQTSVVVTARRLIAERLAAGASAAVASLSR